MDQEYDLQDSGEEEAAESRLIAVKRSYVAESKSNPKEAEAPQKSKRLRIIEDSDSEN